MQFCLVAISLAALAPASARLGAPGAEEDSQGRALKFAGGGAGYGPERRLAEEDSQGRALKFAAGGAGYVP